MIPTLERLAQESNAKIAIGVSTEDRMKERTISGALHVLRRGFAKPILIGSNLSNIPDIETINTSTPEETLIDLMITKKVQGAVRGSLKAHSTLKALKNKLKGFTDKSYIRIALIQHPLSDMAIYLSPVGIEEGNDLVSKKLIISKGVELINLSGVNPFVNLLAAGLYPDDLGRDSHADETIKTATEILTQFANEKKIKIKTSGIMIEQALEEGANLIIPPDGISGNLLYRTLVHVAGWKSFGAALTLQDYKFSDFVYVDTSSIGGVHEYRRALTYASALAKFS